MPVAASNPAASAARLATSPPASTSRETVTCAIVSRLSVSRSATTLRIPLNSTTCPARAGSASGAGRRLRGGQLPGRREGVARLADEGEQGADGQLGAWRGDDPAEQARGRGGHHRGDLLGGELEQLLALLDGVALGPEPLGDHALLHRHAELGHANLGDHRRPPATAWPGPPRRCAPGWGCRSPRARARTAPACAAR